jgi:hypothetical protein
LASRAGRSRPATSRTELAKDKRQWFALVRARRKLDGPFSEDVEELLDYGFSKQMIADLLHVGITEVLRWRSTGEYLPEHKTEMNGLLALCEMLEDGFREAPASFFERYLMPQCGITMQEVYYNGHIDLVLEYAGGRLTAEQVLDAYEPGWRNVPPSMWVVATDEDGELYISMRGEDGG